MSKSLLIFLVSFFCQKCFAYDPSQLFYSGFFIAEENPITRQGLSQITRFPGIDLNLHYNGNQNITNGDYGVNLGYGYQLGSYYLGVNLTVLFSEINIKTKFFEERFDLFNSQISIQNHYQFFLEPGYFLQRNLLLFANLGINQSRLTINGSINQFPYSNHAIRLTPQVGLGFMYALNKYFLLRFRYSFVNFTGMHGTAVFNEEGATTTMHDHVKNIAVNEVSLGLDYYYQPGATAWVSPFYQTWFEPAFNSFYISLAPNLRIENLRQRITLSRPVAFMTFEQFNGNHTTSKGGLNFAIGYGKKFANHYLGLRLAHEFASISAKSIALTASGQLPSDRFTANLQGTLKIDNHFSFTIKPGYFFMYSTLLYGLFGIDRSELKLTTISLRDEAGIITNAQTNRHKIYYSPQVGIGIEKQLTTNLTLWSEYLLTIYHSTNAKNIFFDRANEEVKLLSNKNSVNVNSLFVGLSYYF